jgi:autotransporter passenger strand-loop-strand repeat protein
MSQIIVSGTTSDVTTVDSANTYLVESGGILDILSGGVVSGLITVSQGGELDVSSGGTTLSTVISSGGSDYILGNGSASAITVDSGGYLYLEGGNISGGTINSGGTMFVSGGSFQRVLDNGTFIFGGNNGDFSLMINGGTGSVVISAGTLLVSAATSGDSFAGDFVISTGGTLELQSADAANGRPIDFAGINGTLRIDGASMPNDVIDFLPGANWIDLAGVNFNSGVSAQILSGNVLQIGTAVCNLIRYRIIPASPSRSCPMATAARLSGLAK